MKEIYFNKLIDLINFNKSKVTLINTLHSNLQHWIYKLLIKIWNFYIQFTHTWNYYRASFKYDGIF